MTLSETEAFLLLKTEAFLCCGRKRGVIECRHGLGRQIEKKNVIGEDVDEVL